MTVAAALDRYIKEVIPTKKESSQRRDIGRAEFLKSKLGVIALPLSTQGLLLILETRD